MSVDETHGASVAELLSDEPGPWEDEAEEQLAAYLSARSLREATDDLLERMTDALPPERVFELPARDPAPFGAPSPYLDRVWDWVRDHRPSPRRIVALEPEDFQILRNPLAVADPMAHARAFEFFADAWADLRSVLERVTPRLVEYGRLVRAIEEASLVRRERKRANRRRCRLRRKRAARARRRR